MKDNDTITERFIDLEAIFASKNIPVSKFALRFLNRLLHVDQINEGIYKNRDKEGADFAKAILNYLDISVESINDSNIPASDNPLIVGNHPLGGPDGMALIATVGAYRDDILFPVNDFLMNLPNLRSVFVPIDKVHRNTNNVQTLNEAFAGQNALLYFPAGLCSRRINGKIVDMDWKPTFIKKAVVHQRDVIPVFFEARNRRRFYTIANLRKRMKIKFNFEMALLPGEMFAQGGKTFKITFGKPIPWQTFDKSHSAQEWATLVKEHVYALKENPDISFK